MSPDKASVHGKPDHSDTIQPSSASTTAFTPTPNPHAQNAQNEASFVVVNSTRLREYGKEYLLGLAISLAKSLFDAVVSNVAARLDRRILTPVPQLRPGMDRKEQIRDFWKDFPWYQRQSDGLAAEIDECEEIEFDDFDFDFDFEDEHAARAETDDQHRIQGSSVPWRSLVKFGAVGNCGWGRKEFLRGGSTVN